MQRTRTSLCTAKFAGCGKPGLRIDLSARFITNSSSYNDFRGSRSKQSARSEKAKTFIHKWAHYRYGVFDEHGYVGDPMYPSHYSIPGTDLIKITSCAANAQGKIVEIRTLNRNKNEEECNLSVNAENGLPEQNVRCFPLVDFSSNTEVVSSFMYEPRLVSVDRFCDAASHNSEAPSKHNLLCDAKSVWEVLNEHPDFKDRNFQTWIKIPEVEFKFVESGSPRIVLIVDISYKYTQDFTPIVEKLQKDVQDANGELHIVDYQSSNGTAEGPKLRITGHYSLADICLFCGFAKAFEFIGKNRLKSEYNSSQVIVVSEGRISDNDYTINSIAEQLMRENIKLKVIIFPDTKSGFSKLQSLVTKVNGELLPIAKNSGEMSTMALSQLFDAFEAFKDWKENKPLILNTSIFNREQFNFSFSIDKSLIDAKSSVFVYIFYHHRKEFALCSRTLRLVHESSKDTFFGSHSGDDLLGIKGARGFKLETHQLKVGIWTLSCDSRDFIENFSATAVAIPTLPQETINAICWISKPTEEDNPFAVYTLVVKGYNNYVRDANVMLNVVNSEGNVVQKDVMHDDGFGDPDITKDDGVYSQYITSADFAGRYSVSVLIKSKADTVISEEYGSHPATNYLHVSRVIDCGTLVLEGSNFERRNYFSAINSLRVVLVNQRSRTVDFEFKGPFGAVNKRFEFRLFRSEELSLIKTEFSKRGVELFVWSESNVKYGEVKTIVSVKVPYQEAGYYYFAIRISGGSKREVSRISNVVSFYMRADISYTTAEGNTDSSSQTKDFKTDDTHSNSFNEAATHLHSWQIIAVVAGSLSVIVFTLLLILCFVINAKRRREGQRTKCPKISTPVLQVENKSNFNNIQSLNTPSKPPLTENETTLPELTATISPVQSWPADVLLNHYGRVQQAKERREPPPVMRVEDIPDNVSSVSNNSKFPESTSDEDNLRHHPTWQYEDIQQTSVPPYTQYYPSNEWRHSINNRSETSSDYEQRYGTTDRRGGSAVSQV
ncbi:calcium-activated chloride channel regulator family member 3-like protein [Dinothrombium tinctorium]|uniref:Calcium-activated chloride channel regulator family member 3-like protein n=1 Tax=Dinothrombium tinctorium TaxID=1965070 RepID=A0A3S3P7V4_9ACAR|nr:calcium-activated chloride channel regulator family member 3-like protein [Dinothrombium tinctorium]